MEKSPNYKLLEKSLNISKSLKKISKNNPKKTL